MFDDWPADHGAIGQEAAGSSTVQVDVQPIGPARSYAGAF